MSMKQFIWGGMFVGSGIGGFLPILWGDSALSFSAIVLTFVGGVVGIWIGYMLGRQMGA